MSQDAECTPTSRPAPVQVAQKVVEAHGARSEANTALGKVQVEDGHDVLELARCPIAFNIVLPP